MDKWVWRAGPTAGIGLENMRHVISIHDVVSDTMHQFAPTYHDYVLYSNGGGKEAPPKTARAQAPECLQAARASSTTAAELLCC